MMEAPKHTRTGYPAGSFIESTDHRFYHVQSDGSWRRLKITPEEFHRLRAEALAAKTAQPVAS